MYMCMQKVPFDQAVHATMSIQLKPYNGPRYIDLTAFGSIHSTATFTVLRGYRNRCQTVLRPALITTSAPQLSQPPNSPIHPPCHDAPPYSPHPLFSQLPTVPYTAHLATVLPTTASSPTHPLLRHFPLQPWPPSALPITTHHTLTTPTTRQVVIIASSPPAMVFPLTHRSTARASAGFPT